MNRYDFNYTTAKPYWYNGCYFHSMLELKFALMIEDYYYYIREPVVIPYERHRMDLPKSRWSPVHFYVPDFLIRSKHNAEAYLIEIKPESYHAEWGLSDRMKLVRQYIRKQKLDWKYRLVTEKDIILNDLMQLKYKSVVAYAGDKPYIRSFHTIVPAHNGTELSKPEYVNMIFGKQNRGLFP